LLPPVETSDSYGYRPRKSAHDALRKCRQRCWESNWVVDLDIEKFFDSLDHDLVVRTVEANTGQKWVLLYVKRWLKAPLQIPDGTLRDRDRGTPQGSLCSAEHNPPYEQCRVMRSAGLLALVTAMLALDHCA
jgi:retron-type reverse transcriptase